ncbi:Gamma-crystallin-related [Trinorchestia longiramus]|nr:Gamma-crystallin-related [Trinorchestia longiramus]
MIKIPSYRSDTVIDDFFDRRVSVARKTNQFICTGWPIGSLAHQEGPRIRYPTISKMASKRNDLTTLRWVLLGLVVSSCLTPVLAASLHGSSDHDDGVAERKFVSKPNDIKKIRSQIEKQNAAAAGDPQQTPEHKTGFQWGNLAGMALKMLVGGPTNNANDKADTISQLASGEMTWTKVISLVMEIILSLVGGGDSNSIDRQDVQPGPVENIMSAVIAFLTGSQDPKEINIMAKQASELLGLAVSLLDALRTSFSQRSLEARSLGTSDPMADVAVATTSMVKSFVKTYSTEDDLCMQKYLCEANQECVDGTSDSGYLFCQIGTDSLIYSCWLSGLSVITTTVNPFADMDVRSRVVLVLVLVISYVQCQDDLWAEVFSAPDGEGASLYTKDYIADLTLYLPGVSSVCGAGAWLLYEEPNYGSASSGDSEVFLGSGTCVDTAFNVTSIRQAGSPTQLDRPTLTLYAYSEYRGIEFYITEDLPFLGVFSDEAYSAVVTGPEPWSVYTCGGTDVMVARCGGTDVMVARCRGTDVMVARCGGTDVVVARCGGTDVVVIRCGGTDVVVIRCGGTDVMVGRYDSYDGQATCLQPNESLLVGTTSVGVGVFPTYHELGSAGAIRSVRRGCD